MGECGKYFPKKDVQLIELVLMNLKTPYGVFYSFFQVNWMSHTQDGKDFTFDTFYDFLIKDQQKLLEEGRLGGKIQLWHERLGHLNFRSMNMMLTQDMVIGLINIITLDGVCRGCMIGNHHQTPFYLGKAWHAHE